MKVKELIKELEKFDWDMEVVVYDREDHTYDDCIEIKKEIESYMVGKDGKPIWSRIDKTIGEAEENTKKREKAVRKDILVIYADY